MLFRLVPNTSPKAIQKAVQNGARELHYTVFFGDLKTAPQKRFFLSHCGLQNENKMGTPFRPGNKQSTPKSNFGAHWPPKATQSSKKSDFGQICVALSGVFSFLFYDFKCFLGCCFDDHAIFFFPLYGFIASLIHCFGDSLTQQKYCGNLFLPAC